jgi:cytochrome c oxidase subunit 2
MKYRVVVETPAQFRAWAANQIKPAAKPHGLAAQGQKVFYQNTCISCHFVDAPGSPAHGTVGPNLTHLGSRWTIGAGAAPLTTTDLMAWIRDPSSYKPGVLMPPYPLISQKDLRALAAYLISLK